MKLLESINRRQRVADDGMQLIAGTIAHKFGGSSLADAGRFRHVAELLIARDDLIQVTVVSAMQGVTDSLVTVAREAAAGDAEWIDELDILRERHLDTARELLAQPGATIEVLTRAFADLERLLEALYILRAAPPQTLDLIHGSGELWSALLLTAALREPGADTAMLDAREVLTVEHRELGVAVDWDKSSAQLAAWRGKHAQKRIVITGFIASDDEGRPTTLGRNGSDYSGSIFAALFCAAELHIWTDVDGVLSADPRVVSDAVTVAELSYDEACELAYFGARVVHPQTMIPAISRGLPIFIRNTFHPERPGTRISAAGGDAATPVKGVTLVSGLAIVNVEGAGMIGVPGTAERVFSALRDARVSVVMISQGSSEHSICCVVREGEAEIARVALESEFARELHASQLESIVINGGVTVLAAVGDGMAGTPGIAARLFTALARARVNVRAIAQGSSERNISVAISSEDASKALRAAHSGFWLSPHTISLGLIGPGRVGAALLDQIERALPQLARHAGIDLRLRGVVNSRSMWLGESGASRAWRDHARDGVDLDAFFRHIHAPHLPHAVIIDCSANDEIASRYAEWIGAGVHVITPNKHAGAGPLTRYRAITSAAAASGARFRYEATVGAGLPIIKTLRDLLDTGDELIALEGIFSGTLAWLFNRFDGSMPFSSLVTEALKLGYTEPDPRDDLSGTDVARKLVILAREAGRNLELRDVFVESLVPHELRSSSIEEFMTRLSSLDAGMRERHARAQVAQHVLRYVARLDSSGASVALCELPLDHPFARLRLTDNIVLFRTRRYCDNPLVVQGPGAGPEVTAAGVFADLLRVAAGVGARV